MRFAVAARWRAALRKAWRAACLVLLSLLLLPAAWAESHALLIGVNEVGVLPPRLRLRGPANDVALMRQALISRGMPAPNITVLAQRTLLAMAAPTHAEVRQAMDRIAAAVRDGDTVVLHLAGHGVQVPRMAPLRDDESPEPDGLDEVFLLQDSGTWDATRGELPRSLRDDDIGAWIDQLVDRGARVFAIFDSCHAAGLAREPTPYARWRSVAGAELGIPSALPADRTAARPSRPPQPPRTDGRVLAYAARGHELAGEEWLPKGASVARTRVQGVFSFEVAGVLTAGARTADELAVALRERYAAARRISPSPLVAGQGLLTGR
ncbi:MAG: caspase family protein [Rubrivivax sp.]|nr:caspase family protein [Rubrivivax sp.]